MDRAEIGRRIRKTRLERRLSQSELGKRLGFSDGWVSQVERGGIGLELAQLERVAQALDTSIYEFVVVDPTSSELSELLKPFESELTERDKKELVRIARLKADLNREENHRRDEAEE